MISPCDTYNDAEYITEPATIVRVFEERYDNSTEASDIARLAKVCIYFSNTFSPKNSRKLLAFVCIYLPNYKTNDGDVVSVYVGANFSKLSCTSQL